jgi:hypothetical protein
MQKVAVYATRMTMNSLMQNGLIALLASLDGVAHKSITRINIKADIPKIFVIHT